MRTFVLIYRWTIALFVITVSGCFSLLLILLSFGFLRNFCVQYILKYSSRLILRLMGFKGIFPPISSFPTHPVLYTFNHNSYLDIFLLTGLGIPNTRILLSRSTFKFVPVIISALASGSFFIPIQEKHQQRIQFFKRVTQFLIRKKKFSIIASSEGVHKYTHGIASFNKGIYHMALLAKLPIVALYIHIPKESNPMKGDKHAKGGTLILEYLKEIKTDDWAMENLTGHIKEVREIFVQRFNELQESKIEKI